MSAGKRWDSAMSRAVEAMMAGETWTEERRAFELARDVAADLAEEWCGDWTGGPEAFRVEPCEGWRLQVVRRFRQYLEGAVRNLVIAEYLALAAEDDE